MTAKTNPKLEHILNLMKDLKQYHTLGQPPDESCSRNVFPPLKRIIPGEPLAEGLSAEVIAAIAAEVKKKTGFDAPKEYMEFLGLADGFEHDGFRIYSGKQFIRECSGIDNVLRLGFYKDEEIIFNMDKAECERLYGGGYEGLYSRIDKTTHTPRYYSYSFILMVEELLRKAQSDMVDWSGIRPPT